MPGYDSCGEQHKVEIELMCPFVEQLLIIFKKCNEGLKSAKKNCPLMPIGAEIEPKPFLLANR